LPAAGVFFAAGGSGSAFAAFVSSSVFAAFVSSSVFAAFGSGSGTALMSSGCGGCGLSSSGGRETPVLVSDGLFCVFGILDGIVGGSSPTYAFVLVHRSHQSPTVSYQSFEFCGFSTQCPSSGK
jgi:hypothetical protein